jgi:hypothetical protein
VECGHTDAGRLLIHTNYEAIDMHGLVMGFLLDRNDLSIQGIYPSVADLHSTY